MPSNRTVYKTNLPRFKTLGDVNLTYYFCRLELLERPIHTTNDLFATYSHIIYIKQEKEARNLA